MFSCPDPAAKLTKILSFRAQFSQQSLFVPPNVHVPSRPIREINYWPNFATLSPLSTLFLSFPSDRAIARISLPPGQTTSDRFQKCRRSHMARDGQLFFLAPRPPPFPIFSFPSRCPVTVRSPCQISFCPVSRCQSPSPPLVYDNELSSTELSVIENRHEPTGHQTGVQVVARTARFDVSRWIPS